MLRLHDTATGQVRELAQREPGKVSLYVCGPTVYDVPHIGHGRSVLTYDVLRRYLEWTGLEVRHVSNITDIDDKIIERANEQGRTQGDLAEEFEGVWWDAMDRLGALRPTDSPHATEYVEQISKDVLHLEEGSLYPALHRMTTAGWLQAEWAPSENNRRARYYSITPAGRKQLAEEERNWAELTEAVARVLSFV